MKKGAMLFGLIWVLNFQLLGQAERILLGAYLGSSDNPMGNEGTYYDYTNPLSAGLNLANQRVIVEIAGKQGTNIFSADNGLLSFPYIFAQNDSGGREYRETETSLWKPIVKYKENYDSIYYYTCGYLKRWEAEGDPDFPVGSENYLAFRNNYHYGSLYTENGVSGWKAWIPSQTESEVLLFSTPKFIMQPRYKYTNKMLDTHPVKYNIIIRLRGEELEKYEDDENILKLTVKYINENGDDVELPSFFIQKRDIDVNYSPYEKQFEFQPYVQGNVAAEWKVNYEVTWFNKGEIYIDYLEVYDDEIGVKLHNNINAVKVEINKYLTLLKSNFPSTEVFNQKVLFFSGLDEPHSVYSMEPFRIVTQILNELGAAQQLQTKIYQSFDNENNGYNIFQAWVKKVNPKSLMYWYYPFYWEDTQDPGDMGGKNHLIGYMLKRLRMAHRASQELNSSAKEFYYVPQAWGNEQDWAAVTDYIHCGPTGTNGSFTGWRKPSANELRMQTMAALAYGAKGIIYEPFYTYGLLSRKITGIYNTEDMSLFTEVQNISERLNAGDGFLSKELKKLKHNGIYYEYENASDFSGWTGSNQWATVWAPGANSSYTLLTYHNKTGTDSSLERYFIAQNLRTLETKELRFRIRFRKESSYYNWTVLNLETKSAYSYTTEGEFSENFLPGDAHFYKAGPAVEIGGELTSNETIDSTVSLKDSPLTLASNVILNINGEYKLNKDLTLGSNSGISGTGFIIRNTGTTITAANWNKSLFRSRAGQYVKLIWAAYPGDGTVKHYRVYRKKQSSSFEQIAVVSAGTHSYTDNSTEIITGAYQSNEITAEYYVQAEIEIGDEQQVIYDNSNTIIYYRVAGEALEKRAHGREEEYGFLLEQNHPNPFNPETSIKY